MPLATYQMEAPGKEFGPLETCRSVGEAMDAIFWVGLVLGALAGLGIDLWKRPLDRLLDRRLENRATTRAKQISKRLVNDRQGLPCWFRHWVEPPAPRLLAF
jgi:hypothetical protein